MKYVVGGVGHSGAFSGAYVARVTLYGTLALGGACAGAVLAAWVIASFLLA